MNIDFLLKINSYVGPEFFQKPYKTQLFVGIIQLSIQQAAVGQIKTK